MTGTGSGANANETAELMRLERRAEEAYGIMYDVPALKSLRLDCEDTCGYFLAAIAEAERLNRSEDVVRLNARLSHVRAVYDRQFRGF